MVFILVRLSKYVRQFVAQKLLHSDISLSLGTGLARGHDSRLVT